MSKSIPASKYDEQYFEERYGNVSETDHIYQESASLIKLTENDKVIDLGCGTGQMSILLNLKYSCDVLGIDYSPDAIRLCRENLQKAVEEKKGIEAAKVRFLCCDNDKLSDFQGIKAVFLVDVVEHLYDEEINLVLAHIKKWNNDKIYVVIHTDNNNYLKFLRPVGDFISIHLGKASSQKIKENKKIELERHINLTTARNLKRKLSKHGFSVLKINYPEMSREIIAAQLPIIGKYKALLYPTYFFGRLFYFLRPSFYLLAVYDKNSYV